MDFPLDATKENALSADDSAPLDLYGMSRRGAFRGAVYSRK